MKRWLRILITLLEASLVLAAVYYEPSYAIRGAVRREAWFDGKSTSYWRDELHHWDVTNELAIGWLGYRHINFTRTPSQLEQWRARWFPASARAHDERFEEVLAGILNSTRGPKILHGAKDAEPVLRELLDDASPKVRRFAQFGLGMNPELPGDEDIGDVR